MKEQQLRQQILRYAASRNLPSNIFHARTHKHTAIHKNAININSLRRLIFIETICLFYDSKVPCAILTLPIMQHRFSGWHKIVNRLFVFMFMFGTLCLMRTQMPFCIVDETQLLLLLGNLLSNTGYFIHSITMNSKDFV